MLSQQKYIKYYKDCEATLVVMGLIRFLVSSIFRKRIRIQDRVLNVWFFNSDSSTKKSDCVKRCQINCSNFNLIYRFNNRWWKQLSNVFLLARKMHMRSGEVSNFSPPLTWSACRLAATIYSPCSLWGHLKSKVYWT